jgi:hypothetical protein
MPGEELALGAISDKMNSLEQLPQQGIGMIASAYSMYQTAKLNKERQKLQNLRRQDLNRWFEGEYNKNILDTDYGRGVNTAIEKNVANANKTMGSTAAMTGLTDEAQIAQKQQLNENVTDALSDVAKQGYQRKENVRKEYIGRQGGLDASQSGLWDNTAAQWAQVAKNAQSGLNDSQNAESTGGNDKYFSKAFDSYLKNNKPTNFKQPDITSKVSDKDMFNDFNVNA